MTNQLDYREFDWRLALLLAVGASIGLAQSPGRVRDVNPHAWFVYYGDHPVRNSKWGILTEVQVRRANLGSTWQQLLLREGATYRLSPRVQLGGGYGFIRTVRYGDFPVSQPFKEHRFFEQAIFRHEAAKLALEHRYRVEQRWLEVPPVGLTAVFTGAPAAPGGGITGQVVAQSPGYWRYQQRFRYQLRGSYPISKTNARGQQWYLFGGDELFLHFGANYGASVFDQNRAFFGAGFRLSPVNAVEVSYLNQFLVQRSNLVEESNHTFRLQWTSSMGLFGRR